MPNALSPSEVCTALNLDKISDRNWHVQPSCAKTGDGLYEGLGWLSSNTRKWRSENSIK